jgi:hypothetical protein
MLIAMYAYKTRMKSKAQRDSLRDGSFPSDSIPVWTVEVGNRISV